MELITGRCQSFPKSHSVYPKTTQHFWEAESWCRCFSVLQDKSLLVQLTADTSGGSGGFHQTDENNNDKKKEEENCL